MNDEKNYLRLFKWRQVGLELLKMCFDLGKQRGNSSRRGTAIDRRVKENGYCEHWWLKTEDAERGRAFRNGENSESVWLFTWWKRMRDFPFLRKYSLKESSNDSISGRQMNSLFISETSKCWRRRPVECTWRLTREKKSPPPHVARRHWRLRCWADVAPRRKRSIRFDFNET